MRKLTLLAVICGMFFVASLAQAQQADAMFGLGTIMSSGSCNTTTFTCPEKGGLYPSISADVIFHRRIGFNFETTWRASQAVDPATGQPFRPIILDFNAMYQPKISRKAGLDLMGGVGWQSTRFYLPYCTNQFTCNNFTSNHHFLVDLGAGLRYYVRGHIFVRPEVHYYNILNNTNDFSSNNIIRVGASIGYTIGPD
ncbi:MAG TPA: outer membrane beta-barrel protein [Candidatus Sulfotelmatobacter sp.]|nr:outer membrane beta-barrel protein [Candidatus Sulfotelmatobacter sp.]